jgi:hypothetical protein
LKWQPGSREELIKAAVARVAIAPPWLSKEERNYKGVVGGIVVHDV